MRNPSENFKNRAETAREADTGIDTLFEPQIRQLGGVLIDAAAHGRQGLLWLIDPAVGKGSFWYFPIGDRLAVGAFDFALREEGGFFCDAADCFYFGSYSHEMLPYLGIEPTLPGRTVLGGLEARPLPSTGAGRSEAERDVRRTLARGAAGRQPAIALRSRGAELGNRRARWHVLPRRAALLA